jgi:hypothetical protein
MAKGESIIVEEWGVHENSAAEPVKAPSPTDPSRPAGEEARDKVRRAEAESEAD